jgi:hypothetical protein
MEVAFTKVREMSCAPYNAPGRGLPSVVNDLPPVASREHYEVSAISPDGYPIDSWENIRKSQSQRTESNTQSNASTVPLAKVNGRRPKMTWEPEDKECLRKYLMETQDKYFLRDVLKSHGSRCYTANEKPSNVSFPQKWRDYYFWSKKAHYWMKSVRRQR